MAMQKKLLLIFALILFLLIILLLRIAYINVKSGKNTQSRCCHRRIMTAGLW